MEGKVGGFIKERMIGKREKGKKGEVALLNDKVSKRRERKKFRITNRKQVEDKMNGYLFKQEKEAKPG